METLAQVATGEGERTMPITELLERNAREFPFDISLVEINPEVEENVQNLEEFELIEQIQRIWAKGNDWKEFDNKPLC